MAGRDKHYFRNLISSTFDEIIQDIDSAQVDLSQARCLLKYVQLELVFLKLCSPFPGGSGAGKSLRVFVTKVCTVVPYECVTQIT